LDPDGTFLFDIRVHLGSSVVEENGRSSMTK
jgi:hypothetical protein